MTEGYASKKLGLCGRFEFDRRGALSMLMRDGIDTRADGIESHLSRIVWLENPAHCLEVFYLRVKPQVVFIGSDDDGHPVMDVGYVECCVSSINDVNLVKEPPFS